MCEPEILGITGMSVRQHQELSTWAYLGLRELVERVYVMPVIQGYRSEEYTRHTRDLSPSPRPLALQSR